ncbi:hypothetical protein Bca4012_076094 [Brassica carinata]
MSSSIAVKRVFIPSMSSRKACMDPVTSSSSRMNRESKSVAFWLTSSSPPNTTLSSSVTVCSTLSSFSPISPTATPKASRETLFSRWVPARVDVDSLPRSSTPDCELTSFCLSPLAIFFTRTESPLVWIVTPL